MTVDELFEPNGSVPGVRPGVEANTTTATPPTADAPLSLEELRELGLSLAARSRDETSVVAKARGLWLASEVLASAELRDESRRAAEESAETSPKLLWPALTAAALGTPAETIEGWLLDRAKYATDVRARVFAARELATRELRRGKLASARSLLDPLAQRGLLGERDVLRRAGIRLALDGTTAGVDLGTLDPAARRLEENTATVVSKNASSPHSALPRARDAFERGQRVDAALALAPYRAFPGVVEAMIWLTLGTPYAAEFAARSDATALGVRGLAFVLDDLCRSGLPSEVLRLGASKLDAGVASEGNDLALFLRLLALAFDGALASPPREGGSTLAWGAGYQEALLGLERDSPHAQTERLGARLTHREGARKALDEASGFLLDRSRDSQRAFLGIAFALLDGDDDGALGQLLEVARTEDEPALFLGVAALAERVGRADLVEETYERARTLAMSSGGEVLRAEALRGLLRAAPDRREAILAELAECTDSPDEKANYELERLLGGPAQEALGSLLALFEATGEAGYLLAALGCAADDETRSSVLERLATARDESLASLATIALALDRAATDPETSHATLRHAARLDDSDVSFAAALHTLAGEFVPSASASEWLVGSALVSFVAEDAPERALDAARALGKRSPTPLLDRVRRSLQRRTGDHERLVSDVLEAARGASRETQLATFELLADLELERGRPGAAELWIRALLNERPDAASSHLRLEEFAIVEGRGGEIREIGERLAALLPRPDAEPYALALAAEALARGELRDARRLVEALADDAHSPALAARILATSARDRRDDAGLTRGLAPLVVLATTDLDRMALSLELAATETRRGHASQAMEHALRASDARPGSFPSEWLLASLEALAPNVDDGARAERLWSFALATAHSAGREALAVEAGSLFLRSGDTARAVVALGEALALGPRNDVAFSLLRAHLRASGDHGRCLALVTARLELDLPGSERFELELEAADLALELGETVRAREALERALGLHPKNSRVLRLHAKVSAELGDHEAAIASLRDLVAKLEAPDERRDVWLTLARIYDEKLSRLEPAMDCLEAALALDPEDRDLARRLVDVLARLGLGERATTLLTSLIQKSTSGDEKRVGAVRLAELYETVSRDAKRAYATLDRARKAWPFDALLVRKMAELMDRLGESGPRRLMLERVQKDTQRKLLAERIDAGLLETLAEVARQSGEPARADIITAAERAFVGEPAPLTGAGLKALASALDPILAPSVLTSPLLNLLRKTGPALDAAFPLDLASLEARPVAEGATVERLRAVCAASGLASPEVFLAPSLGSRCLPLTREPLRFLVGPRLGELPQDCMDYLILRAIKLQLLGAGAIARSRVEDTWPMLASMLLLFAPQFRPKNVDTRKATQARALVEQGLSRVGYDSDVPVLALETIGSLGDAGENVGEAIRLLASRAALLGMGSPHAALLAISAGSEKPIPDQGPARFRWFEAHPEARDLLLFLTTDAYAEARSRVGLLEERVAARPRPPTRGPAFPSAGPTPPITSSSGNAPEVPNTSAPPLPVRPASAFAPPPPRRGGSKGDE